MATDHLTPQQKSEALRLMVELERILSQLAPLIADPEPRKPRAPLRLVTNGGKP